MEPYEYIKKILTALPYNESVEDFEALLPWNIKKIESIKIGQAPPSMSAYVTYPKLPKNTFKKPPDTLLNHCH